MRTLKYLLLTVLLMCSVRVSANELDVVRERIALEIMNLSQVDDGKVEQIISTFEMADSIWSGINYQDTTKTAFEHTRHLSNMTSLARAYRTEGSKWHSNPELKGVFDTSLAFWAAHNFLCENWWNNEIGTPTEMISILYIMDEALSSQQREQLLAIASRANLNAWGARPSGDRIKLAGLEAKQHIYLRDEAKTLATLAVIEEEITIHNRTRGVQADLSFHHRTDRVNNTLSYGLNFINVFAEWVGLLSQTNLQFNHPSMELAIDYYLDGVCKQMVYGVVTDVNVMNREISRPTGKGGVGVETPMIFIEATTYRHSELERILAARRGEEFTAESFAKFFWESDHFVLQRPNFYTSVRMYSTRNASMEEPYNGEGLLSHFKGDGANYLSMQGGEHLSITPYNDWLKIPGTTTLQVEQMPDSKYIRKFGTTSFAGAVCDGLYGAVGFDFKSPLTNITAKKGWFFFDDEYVCLGAGINSDSEQPIATTIEQRAMSGEVNLKSGGKVTVQDSNSELQLSDVEWVHHNNTGYYFPENQRLHISNQEQQGSWRDINIQSYISAEQHKGEVFKLWLEHSPNADNESYSYVVLPSTTLVEMPKRGIEHIDIIQNDSQAQVVKHNKLGILYAVLYQAGSVSIGNGSTLSVDIPVILMVKSDKKGRIESIYASDPNRDKQSLELTVTNKKGTTKYRAELPQGELAGTTLSCEL